MTGRVQRACLLVVLAMAACKKAAPPQEPQRPDGGPATMEVVPDAGLVFTYVEPSGAFAATPDPEQVAAQSRRVVRVVDPRRPVGNEAEISDVYVVDLNQFLRSGKTEAQRMSRAAFETAALAQLPPGQSTAWAPGQPRPAPEPGPTADPAAQSSPGGVKAAGPSGAPTPGGTPVVTIYGTSWCGACRAARQYFSERKIPFADKDIEQDAAAASELRAKAARLGISADRVPVLDIRGRLLQGFDRARVEALLGAPT